MHTPVDGGHAQERCAGGGWADNLLAKLFNIRMLLENSIMQWAGVHVVFGKVNKDT